MRENTKEHVDKTGVPPATWSEPAWSQLDQTRIVKDAVRMAQKTWPRRAESRRGVAQRNDRRRVHDPQASAAHAGRPAVKPGFELSRSDCSASRQVPGHTPSALGASTETVPRAEVATAGMTDSAAKNCRAWDGRTVRTGGNVVSRTTGRSYTTPAGTHYRLPVCASRANSRRNRPSCAVTSSPAPDYPAGCLADWPAHFR